MNRKKRKESNNENKGKEGKEVEFPAILFTSVVDPVHFFPDPDPQIRF